MTKLSTKLRTKVRTKESSSGLYFELKLGIKNLEYFALYLEMTCNHCNLCLKLNWGQDWNDFSNKQTAVLLDSMAGALQPQLFVPGSRSSKKKTSFSFLVYTWKLCLAAPAEAADVSLCRSLNIKVLQAVSLLPPPLRRRQVSVFNEDSLQLRPCTE